MASRIAGRLRGILSSVLSVFNPFKRQPAPPPRRREYKRIKVQNLIRKCKKGSTQHSIYRKILAKRLNQQLRQSNKAGHQQTSNSTQSNRSNKSNQLNKLDHPNKSINQSTKKHKTTPQTKQLHHKVVTGTNNLNSFSHSPVKSQQLFLRPPSRVIYFPPPPSPPTHQSEFDNEALQASEDSQYIITRSVQQDTYAPSAPLWTPPPSPRRGSLPDPTLAVSYPLSLAGECPHVLSEGVLMYPTPAVPTAPSAPEAGHGLYPALQHSANPSSPPFSRRHFAQFYIPHVKTNIPYITSPAHLQAPLPMYEAHQYPPNSRPAPYAPLF